jgi:hypothetical protein
MKTEVLNDFLGALTMVNYVVSFIFIFIALALKWIWQTIDSVKNNESTPVKFSWKYWAQDNLLPKVLSLISNIIVAFIVLRFGNELFGLTFSYAVAFGIGIALDYWVNRLKKMQILNITPVGEDPPPPPKKP